MGIFTKRQHKPVELPAIMQPEEPVNYDSVLDWLLGLDDKDYKVMLEVVEVYRNANRSTAKLLTKVKQNSQLTAHVLTDEQIDEGLDAALNIPPKELREAIANEPTAGEMLAKKALERN